MTLKGYYRETIYPRFSIYKIYIINMFNEFSMYTVAVKNDEKIEDRYPDYIDLGGVI